MCAGESREGRDGVWRCRFSRHQSRSLHPAKKARQLTPKRSPDKLLFVLMHLTPPSRDLSLPSPHHDLATNLIVPVHRLARLDRPIRRNGWLRRRGRRAIGWRSGRRPFELVDDGRRLGRRGSGRIYSFLLLRCETSLRTLRTRASVRSRKTPLSSSAVLCRSADHSEAISGLVRHRERLGSRRRRRAGRTTRGTAGDGGGGGGRGRARGRAMRALRRRGWPGHVLSTCAGGTLSWLECSRAR